jgi:molecular chaperone HtpG
MKEHLKASIPDLLHNNAMNLYPTNDVVIRELIQNSYDSIILLYNDEVTTKGRIEIKTTKRSIEISDNGIGMNDNELRNYLSNMGKSLKTKVHKKLIGKYGIGFFSSFLIADGISVFTRKHNESQGYLWESDGSLEYEIKTSDIVDSGTRIVINLQRSSYEYSNVGKIKSIIKHYCNFLDCPIFLNEEIDPINSMKFPWEFNTKSSILKSLKEHYNYDIKYYKCFNINEHNASFIFVIHPECDREVEIYQKRIFVTDSIVNIIPDELYFLKVILNGDDFELTLSREQIKYYDRSFNSLKSIISLESWSWISELVDKHYNDSIIKELITTNKFDIKKIASENRNIFDKIYNVILFNVYAQESKFNITDYVEKTHDSQKRIIYYRENKAGVPQREVITLLSLLNNINILVFSVKDELDEDLLRRISNKMRMIFVEITDVINEFVELISKATETEFSVINQNFLNYFNKEVRYSSLKPISMPLALVGDTIILNKDNYFLKDLDSVNFSNDFIRELYFSLYNFSIEIGKNNLIESEKNRLFQELMKSLNAWLKLIISNQTIKAELNIISNHWWLGPIPVTNLILEKKKDIKRNKYHFNCFIVCPFKTKYKDVINIVKETLQKYDIDAKTAEEINNINILSKVCQYIDNCDFAIVDISELNPNVMLELGLLIARRKPSVIIRNRASEEELNIKVPSDIISIERIEYENISEDLCNKLNKLCSNTLKLHVDQSK